MKFEAYPDREFLMLGLANTIAGQLADFLRREGRASLCVPGGTTPGPTFDTLSGVDLDWSQVAVFLNDERWVGEDSPRSNTRLLRERLLRGKAAEAVLVPLYAPAETPEERLAELEEGLRPAGAAGRGGGRAAHHPDRAGPAGRDAHPYPDHRGGEARRAGARADPAPGRGAGARHPRQRNRALGGVRHE